MPLILDTPPRTPSPPKQQPQPQSHSQSHSHPRKNKPVHTSSHDHDDTASRTAHDSNVVIVGAGILGSALAVALARQGRSVTLLERSLKQPDRIVGELLQPGGVRALETLGLRDCLEGIDAVRVLGYECFYHGTPVAIPYPDAGDFSADIPGEKQDNGRAKGQAEGRSFHHGRFVSKLREAAAAQPNVTVVESTVTSLVRDGMQGNVLGVECTTAGKPDYYFADLTVVCDGYASKFRAPTSTVTSSSKFYALELLDCALPAPLHGHVILSDAAPILLYQIGTRETRALIDVPANCAQAAAAAGGVPAYLRKVVLPVLPPPVRPSFEAALDAGKLRSMPNSYLQSKTNTVPGLATLGDAANMRHPLTGGGMTVALNDVVLLSEMLRDVSSLQDTELVLDTLRAFHWRRKPLAAVINILAMALYALFAADDARLRVLQMGCIRYFERGGECIRGPVSLLSGLNPRPWVLFYHFFSVALYSIWLLLVGGGGVGALLALPVRLVQAVGVFWTACVVLLPYVFSELRR